MSLTSPFRNIELYTQVELFPHQKNNDLYLNLKNNLKRLVEHKCNKYGYINEVHQILDYSNGVYDPNNFQAIVKYNVKYTANICIVIENTQIIAKVERINRQLVSATNGPIIAIIKVEDFNPSKFTLKGSNILYKQSDRTVKEGDFIKITVKTKRFSVDEKYIGVLGYTDDFATDEEIKKFHYAKKEEQLEDDIKKNGDHAFYNEDSMEAEEDNKKVKVSTVIDL